MLSLTANYTTALGFTFLIAGTLLSPCLCAPTSLPDPWWFNPSAALRLRHSRSADQHLTPVKRQLKIFVNDFGMCLKQINSLYKQTPKSRTPGKLSWLKINKMLKKMKSPATRLQAFHENLQFFAGTLHVLSNIKIRTNATHFNENERDRIYNKTTMGLKLLMGEVHWSLMDSNQPLPKGIPLEKMKIAIPESLDVTGVHMLDIAFFKRTKSFFTRSQKLFKQKNPTKKQVKKVKSVVNKAKRTRS